MPDFVFRLPTDNLLTDAQRIALHYNSSIVVSGGPGSGKTVVTIYKFLVPVRNNRAAILFTYNKTLLASIKGLLRAKSEELFGELNEETIRRIIGNSVASFSKFVSTIHYSDIVRVEQLFQNKIHLCGNRKYAEVLFDEAQDLTPAVFSKAFILADKVTCGADNAQNLQGNFPPDEAVDIILNSLRMQSPTDFQELEANFRNTKQIFEFARGFAPIDNGVHSLDITNLPEGDSPEIIENLNDIGQLNYILQVIQNNPTANIGILVNNKNQVISIKEHLERHQYSCQANAPDNLSFSYYYNGMNELDEQVLFDRMKTPLIVTYDSCKGLEFDIVIMPFFNYAESSLYNQRRRYVDGVWVNEYNVDGSPKMWATWNHYYVGVTRTRNLLYVLCNNRPKILDFFLHNNIDDLPF